VTQPLTLSAGGVVGSHGIVWFSTGESTTALSAITFDPGTVAVSDGWRSWPFDIYISSAGCYGVGIEWGSGHTGSFFAAGA
jgi:hypothetical protein